MKRSLLRVLLVCSLSLGGCAAPRERALPLPPPQAPERPFDRAVVYDPAGRLLAELPRGAAHRLLPLLEQGAPQRDAPGVRDFVPLSYSIGFSLGSSKRFSVQLFGRAEQAVLPNGATLRYTKQQQRQILQIIDPEQRWQYGEGRSPWRLR